MQRLYLDRGTASSRDLAVAILAGSCVGGGTSVNWQTSLRLPDTIRHEWASASGLSLFADEPFTRALDHFCERSSVGTEGGALNVNNEELRRGFASFRWSRRLVPG